MICCDQSQDFGRIGRRYVYVAADVMFLGRLKYAMASYSYIHVCLPRLARPSATSCSSSSALCAAAVPGEPALACRVAGSLAAHGRAAGSVAGPAAGGPAGVAGGRSYWLGDETINLSSDDTVYYT